MKTIEQFLEEKSKNSELDFSYVYQDGMTFSEYEEAIDTYIRESSDIIYYSNAIEFLKDNDPSLMDSLQLAADLGYTPDNLNSEMLATLLNQQMLFEEWGEISSEIEEYFEEYENYLFELENKEEE